MGIGEVMADSPPPPPPGFTLVDAPPPPPPGFKLQQAQTSQRARPYSATDLISSKATMGLSDKVGAAGDVIGGYLASLITGKRIDPASDRYDRAYAAETAAKANYKAEHPGVDWATLPANLLGFGPGKAVEGASRVVTAAAARAAAVKTGVVAGTVTGATAGVGNSHGSAGDQAAQVALSSGLGAVTGGLVTRYLPGIITATTKKVAPYLERLIETVAPGRAAGPVSGAPRSIHSSGAGVPTPGVASPTAAPTAATPAQAAPDVTQAPPVSVTAPRTTAPRLSQSHQILSDKISADGNTPRQVAQQIEAARQRGVPLAIMDTGDNVRGLATGVANAPGASRKIMRDAVISRQEGQTERVQGAINRDLGPTVGVATEAQRLEDTAKATARPLYEKAYAAGAVDSPTIKALLAHPEMQAAVDAGKQIHANETFLANAKGETPPEPLVDGFPDVRTLDYAKRALDRKIDSAYSGDSQAKMQVPFLKDLRSTLLTSLDKAVPEYGAARAAYAGPSQMKEALESCQRAPKFPRLWAFKFP